MLDLRSVDTYMDPLGLKLKAQSRSAKKQASDPNVVGGLQVKGGTI